MPSILLKYILKYKKIKVIYWYICIYSYIFIYTYQIFQAIAWVRSLATSILTYTIICNFLHTFYTVRNAMIRYATNLFLIVCHLLPPLSSHHTSYTKPIYIRCVNLRFWDGLKIGRLLPHIFFHQWRNLIPRNMCSLTYYSHAMDPF